MKSKLVIFDFDGTIADSFATIINLVYPIFQRRYKNVKKKDFINDIKNSSLKELFKKYKLNKLKVILLLIYIKIQYYKQLKDINVRSNMRSAIKSLKKEKYKLGIISSAKKGAIIKFLHNKKLEMYFDFVEESGLFDKSRFIAKAIEKQGVDKERVVYIGDEVRDIEACKEAGIKCISLEGFNSYSLLKEKNSYSIKHPKEIIKTINKIFYSK